MAKKEKPDTWMPLYIGDYLRDTTRLSTEQHGAYLLLIMDYWINGPLPDDDEALANVTRLPLPAWKKNRPVLIRLFKIEGGEWHHKRINEELAAAHAFIEKQKANGAKGGRPKGSQKKPMGFDSVSKTGENENPTHPPNESPSPSPKTHISVEKTSTATEPSTRFAQMLLLLTQLEAARGIPMGPIPSTDAELMTWVGLGITDAEIREAHGMAKAERDRIDPQCPIKPGFVSVFLAKIRNPAKPLQVVIPDAQDWRESNAEIERRGKELGLSFSDYLTQGKQWPEYKADVIEAVEGPGETVE